MCLATIVKQKGSSPRKRGAHLFIHRDGRIEGTIGGGLLEAEVIQAGRHAMKHRASRLIHFDLRGRNAAESAMLCGGDVQVYLEPLYACDEQARTLFRAAADIVTHGGGAFLMTLILPGEMPGIRGKKLLYRDGGGNPGFPG